MFGMGQVHASDHIDQVSAVQAERVATGSGAEGVRLGLTTTARRETVSDALPARRPTTQRGQLPVDKGSKRVRKSSNHNGQCIVVM